MTFGAGWGQTLALKTNGSMVGWGDNFNGKATPRAGTNFVAVAGGSGYSLALKTDGSLVGWGGNSSGQATVPADTNFVAISAGYNLSLAIQVQLPILNIARAGNDVVLSWPANETGYSLESSTDLTLPVNWSKVPGTPAITGNQYTVTESLANGNRLYRLKK